MENELERLSTFHDRSVRGVLGDSGTFEDIQSVVNANKIRACRLVRKCIDKDIFDAFQGYSISMTTPSEQEIISLC